MSRSRQFSRHPLASTHDVGGFYDEAKTWKLRFAPMEVGGWTWQLSFDDAGGEYATNGKFTCVASGNSGFLRVHPKNPYRFVTEGDGQGFYPLGFNWGLPKPYVGPDGKLIEPAPLSEQSFPIGIPSQPTALGDALLSMTNAGNNMFRHNSILDAFNFFGLQGQFNINKRGKNRYDSPEPVVRRVLRGPAPGGDEVRDDVLARPRRSRAEVQLVRSRHPPSLLGYHQYLINRYSAYVDIWELANQQGDIPKSYGDAVTAYIRAHDPYVHLITVSYPQETCQSDFDITSPIGIRVPRFAMDSDIADLANSFRKFQQPILVGEFGAGGDVGGYDPPRIASPSGRSLFNEIVLLSWNGAYKSVLVDGRAANNQYVGWEERGASKTLTDFVSGFDPEAVRVTPALTPANQVRGYALAGAKELAAYIVHGPNLNTVLTGATLKVDVPAVGMQGQWIDPASGAILQSFAAPGRGPQTLTIPPFQRDIALPCGPTRPRPSCNSLLPFTAQGGIREPLPWPSWGADTAKPLRVAYSTATACGQGRQGLYARLGHIELGGR